MKRELSKEEFQLWRQCYDECLRATKPFYDELYELAKSAQIRMTISPYDKSIITCESVFTYEQQQRLDLLKLQIKMIEESCFEPFTRLFKNELK